MIFEINTPQISLNQLRNLGHQKMCWPVLSHAVIKTITYISCWDAKCEFLHRTFLQSPLEDVSSQVWLLQLYLPKLTGSGEIDGSKELKALTFWTLVEKHEVF